MTNKGIVARLMVVTVTENTRGEGNEAKTYTELRLVDPRQGGVRSGILMSFEKGSKPEPEIGSTVEILVANIDKWKDGTLNLRGELVTAPVGAKKAA